MGIMFRSRSEQRGGVTLYHAPPGCPARGLLLNEHIDESGEIVFRHACKLGLEGIVSKRLGSPYRSGRSRHWLKLKNPACAAAKREEEEDWGGWKKSPREGGA